MQGDWEARLTAESLDALRSAAPPSGASRRLGELASAFEVCRQITLEHSRTFFFASALLPRAKRQAVRALYAFCRCTDDIIDGQRSDGLEAMRRWQAAAASTEPPPDQPVLLAWSHTRGEYGIPDALAARLVEGVCQDLHQTRYSTFDELVDYCFGVASTVGLMSMQIIGCESEEAVPYAIKLGVAMQMTNILRDVAEDYAMGRIYLPQEELARYGVDERQIAEGVADEAWERFVRFQIERTRRLYAEAWPGIPMLSADGQFAIAAAADLYAGILREIERQDYDVFSRRAHVSKLTKLSRLPGIYARLRKYRRASRRRV